MRATLVIAGVSINILEVAGLLVVQPMLVMNRGITELYESGVWSSNLIAVLVGAVLSLVLLLTASALLRPAGTSVSLEQDPWTRWHNWNVALGISGAMITIFAVVGIALSFHYLNLEDLVNGPIAHAPFALFVANMILGPLLLLASLVSSLTRAISKREYPSKRPR